MMLCYCPEPYMLSFFEGYSFAWRKAKCPWCSEEFKVV